MMDRALPADGPNGAAANRLTQRRHLTRACSRQASGALGSARVAPSLDALWNVGLCGRQLEGLQLMRQLLGRDKG